MRAPCARHETDSHLDRCLHHSVVGRTVIIMSSVLAIPQGGFHMLEQELVRLVKSFLGRRKSVATAEECRAWEDFFVTYDAMIRVTVRRIHKAVDVVDDVTQDVWVVLMRKLPKWKFDPVIGSIGAWVTKIAQRLAVKRARRHARQQSGSLSKAHDDTLVDPESGPDIEFEWMQEHELFGALVLKFAATLIERHGRIVVLHWLEGCLVSKIAFDLNMSMDAAWGVIRRVRPKLLDYLRRSGLRPT
jgi:RNA polymerase sigma factor (sigma-70 family)